MKSMFGNYWRVSELLESIVYVEKNKAYGNIA